MNCREARERMTDTLDACAQTTIDLSLREHLETCPVCTEEYAGLKQAMEALPTARVAASLGFTEAVMSKIQDMEPQRSEQRRFGVLRAGLAATVALAVCAGVSFSMWYVKTGGTQKVAAFRFLGDAAHAMARVQTVRIQAQMRTLPNDNFEHIVLTEELVPVELWADLREPMRWRVEKPGRVAVSDGENTTLLIEPNKVVTTKGDSDIVGWMDSLLKVEDLLYNETSLAGEEGSQITMTSETTPEGVKEDVLRIEAKAQGDFTNDWLRNSSVSDSDNLRVYRFEPDTKLLKGLEIYVHVPQGDVLVFQTTDVSYELPADEKLFALEIPENAIFAAEPQKLSDNEKYERMSPREAAQSFFEACSREDYDEALKYWFMSSVDDRFKEHLGGVQIIELGAAFKSGEYPGWFVPYEIRFKNGDVQKHNLAVRNDNAAHRFVVDGGI